MVILSGFLGVLVHPGASAFCPSSPPSSWQFNTNFDLLWRVAINLCELLLAKQPPAARIWLGWKDARQASWVKVAAIAAVIAAIAAVIGVILALVK
jgi:hypothetical protein